ncbi:hypothetical protein [Salinimonas marina]|uniref:hypothetical protein n=1 Tax=Salinimonas marina TaxID=2785918 RepID=UPI002FC29F51
MVKVFYSLTGDHFLEPKNINLATDTRLAIDSAVLASDYKIDFNTFFERSITV